MADTPSTPSESTPPGAPQGNQQNPPQQDQTPPAQPQSQPSQPAAQPPADQQPEAKQGGVLGNIKMPEVKMPDMKVPELPSILKKAENQPPVKSEEKLWALVSYIPLVGLISLILKPESAYIRLHGRQGLLLFVIFFFSIFVYLFPFIGPLIGALIHIGVIVLGVFSMYQAFIGNWWKIPVIGDIAEQIPIDAFTKVTRDAVMGPGTETTPPEQPTQGSTDTIPPSEPPASNEQPPSEGGQSTPTS